MGYGLDVVGSTNEEKDFLLGVGYVYLEKGDDGEKLIVEYLGKKCYVEVHTALYESYGTNVKHPMYCTFYCIENNLKLGHGVRNNGVYYPIKFRDKEVEFNFSGGYNEMIIFFGEYIGVYNNVEVDDMTGYVIINEGVVSIGEEEKKYINIGDRFFFEINGVLEEIENNDVKLLIEKIIRRPEEDCVVYSVNGILKEAPEPYDGVRKFDIDT